MGGTCVVYFHMSYIHVGKVCATMKGRVFLAISLKGGIQIRDV